MPNNGAVEHGSSSDGVSSSSQDDERRSRDRRKSGSRHRSKKNLASARALLREAASEAYEVSRGDLSAYAEPEPTRNESSSTPMSQLLADVARRKSSSRSRSSSDGSFADMKVKKEKRDLIGTAPYISSRQLQMEQYKMARTEGTSEMATDGTSSTTEASKNKSADLEYDSCDSEPQQPKANLAAASPAAPLAPHAVGGHREAAVAPPATREHPTTAATALRPAPLGAPGAGKVPELAGRRRATGDFSWWLGGCYQARSSEGELVEERVRPKPDAPMRLSL